MECLTQFRHSSLTETITNGPVCTCDRGTWGQGGSRLANAMWMCECLGGVWGREGSRLTSAITSVSEMVVSYHSIPFLVFLVLMFRSVTFRSSFDNQ
jgi:hypothetical protein